MLSTYDRQGLRLQYPETWSILEEGDDEQFPSLTLHNSDGAQWSLTVHPATQSRPELMAEVLRSMRDEYQAVDSEWTTETLGSWDAAGYDMDFFCQHFVVTAHARCVTVGGRNFVFLYQAESRDFEKLHRVFQALAISLLQEQDRRPLG